MHWIVVGAGSAGCVLAARLSEDLSHQVTLLDDGPDLVPGKVPAAIEGRSFYDALAEPGRSHEQLLARRTSDGPLSVYQRGRGVGGSSAVNAMVALRGSSDLYRSWGWNDADTVWDRVSIPVEAAGPDEIGPVGEALLAAEPGARVAEMTRRNGRRVTSAEAYLWPIRDRTNLTVRSDSGVDAVTFEGTRATGVRLRDGTELAGDHVVMAAGAIHTPAILLRSGVSVDGLGQGLQDHPAAAFALALREPSTHDPSSLAVAALAERRSDDDASLQLLALEHIGRRPETAGLGVLMVALMNPRGRAGSVTVDSSGAPVVDFALLQDPGDIAALVSGVRWGLDVLARPEFEALVGAAFIDDQGTETSALTDDVAIADWVTTNVADYVHASGTCAMGTVVDHDGAVVGHEALSVGDASIFPSIPDANTHLPTTMAAERIAERLRRGHAT